MHNILGSKPGLILEITLGFFLFILTLIQPYFSLDLVLFVFFGGELMCPYLGLNYVGSATPSLYYAFKVLPPKLIKP